MLAEHLSSEKQVRRNGRLVWERINKENHLFDCEVLATACADVTFTPSLPAYVQQLQAAQRAANMQQQTAPRKKKQRPQPQSRWA